MDLLTASLRVADAVEHRDAFKKYGIDAFTLKNLNEEDLRIIGIDDAKKRLDLLEKFANLQIPRNEKFEGNLTIDENYVKNALYIMESQLQKHRANLTLCVGRDDVTVCDVTLGKAVSCLDGCLMNFLGGIRSVKVKSAGQTGRKARKNLKIAFCGFLLAFSAVTMYKVLKN